MAATLSDRVAAKASRSDLLDSIRALPLSLGMTADAWSATISSLHPVFASDLAWLTRSEQNWVFGAAKDRVRGALTEFFPNECQDLAHLEQVLAPFVDWLEDLPDRMVVAFCWDILAWRPSLGWTYAWYPVRRMRASGRLSGEISQENIQIAVTICEGAEAMGSWPKGRWRFVQWERDSQTYFESAEDPSYLVRAASAYALGALFLRCHRDGGGCGAPIGSRMFEWLQQQERKRAGVAGPFLQGAEWYCTETDEWLAMWQAPADFDIRSWFLDTLRTSSREPDVPHLISLEFFAHEFFSCDGAAIEEMMKMGREHLAVLTATEEPQCIDRLLPVLTKMSESPNPRVAAGIQMYLKERRTHAGMGLWEDPEE